MQPFEIVWCHLHVAGQNFEEQCDGWLFVCIKLAGVYRCAGKAESHPTGVTTQLSGKGIAESLLLGLVGLTHFSASGNVCNLAPF